MATIELSEDEIWILIEALNAITLDPKVDALAGRLMGFMVKTPTEEQLELFEAAGDKRLLEAVRNVCYCGGCGVQLVGGVCPYGCHLSPDSGFFAKPEGAFHCTHSHQRVTNGVWQCLGCNLIMTRDARD